MAKARALNISTDPASLLLLGVAAFGVYYVARNGGLSGLFNGFTNWAAGANYNASNAVANYLFPPDPLPHPGAGTPGGFAPPANDPYYAAWLAEAAGYPPLMGDIAPYDGPVGQIFDQFGTGQASPYARMY